MLNLIYPLVLTRGLPSFVNFYYISRIYCLAFKQRYKK
jgi:hypothetical protein